MDFKTKELVKNVCIFCCNTYRQKMSSDETFRLFRLTKSGIKGKKNYHKLKRQPVTTVPPPLKAKRGTMSNLVQKRRFLACNDPNFREFCNLIESFRKSKNDGGGGDDEFSTDALMQSMAFFKALAVCEQCLRRLTRWNEVRERIIKREEEILRLQKKLLKELKGLDQDLGPYQEDLEFIEEGIRKSDVDYLEQFLDAIIESERTTSENEESGLLHKAIVTSYRKLALEASVELKSFRRKLGSWNNPSFKSVPHKRPRTPPADEDDELPPKQFHREKIKIVVPGSHVSGDPCSSSVALDPVAGDNDNLVIKAEIESDGVYQSENEAELPCYDDNLSEGLLQDQDGDAAYSGSSSVSDDEYVEKTRSKRRSKRAMSRSHNRYNLRPTSDVDDYSSAWSGNDNNDSDSDEAVNFESDLDEDPRDTDFVPEDELKRKLEVVIPSAVKFDEQSEFTKSILEKVYRRIALRNSDQFNDPIPKDDPRYEYVVDYDPERRRLFVGGIDIIINEEQRRLECSQCDYTNGKLEHGQLLSKLRHHIMGKHLELYKCSQCPKKFSLISSYKAHMRLHKNESAFVCDVCGRPLVSSNSLHCHKWSHMNADEVAEALAKGLKDPRYAKQERKATCPECGKNFRQWCELKQHERNIHGHGHRTKFPCSQCGKLLFEESLQSHMKYSCPNRNQDDDEVNTRLECFRCPGKKFKNIIVFKRHMKHGHKPVEKKFVCETCGAAYVNNHRLQMHVRTKHLGERPFACGLGCGATFTRKNNAERHQSTCPLGKARTETTESSRKTEDESNHKEPEQQCYYYAN